MIVRLPQSKKSNLQKYPDKSNFVEIYEEHYQGSKDTTKTSVVPSVQPISDGNAKADSFSNALTSKSSTDYQKFSSSMTNVILRLSATGPQALNLSNPANNKLTINKPVNFTNHYINKNAWRFDYTLTRPSPAGQSVKVDGVFIYAFGQKSLSTLLISSVEDNWKAKTADWKKVIDSLQLDQ
jgi:hypothetical protein